MRILQFNDQAVRVRTDLSRALTSLERQSLMGQSSFSSFDLCSLTDNNSSGATLYQASLEDDNRYQALAARGEAGQLLAEYQQQRVETRRQAVDQYVDTYYQLARRFASEVDPDWNGDFSAERTSLQQLIEDFNETSPEQIAQRDQRISEINQLQQQLGSQVAQRFSLDSANEHFSLQDMVANLIANRPVSSLNDGRDHPQAAEIEQFYTQHRSQIDRYRDLAQRSQQAVDKSGLRIIPNPLGPGIGYERLRENIEARLQTQSRTELLASIDDPRLAHQVQRYFDTDGFTQMARPEARLPPLWRPPVRPPMPEQTAFSVHGPQPPRNETPPDSPDTLLNSIQDPLIKAALAQFLRP